MFHVFIIEKLNLLGITTVSYPSVVSVPKLTIFAFTICLLGAFLAEHIPVVKKTIYAAYPLKIICSYPSERFLTITGGFDIL